LAARGAGDSLLGAGRRHPRGCRNPKGTDAKTDVKERHSPRRWPVAEFAKIQPQVAMTSLYTFSLAANLVFAQVVVPHQDGWFGIDKLKHFFMSAFIESVTYSALQAAKVKHRPALGSAIGVTMAVGVARELHDRRVPGNLFSVRDLTWDAIGTTAGAVMLSHTIR
jgi:uncharacterized protein YfiM (DUF2279 family)